MKPRPLGRGESLYLSIQRDMLSGDPRASYTSRESSLFHPARTLGVNGTFNYDLGYGMKIFLATEINGVGNVTNQTIDSSGFVTGYHFDGLRYNAKLGVSWKI